MRATDDTTTSSNGNGSHRPGRTKRSKWPLAIAALLGGHVMILVAVVMVATRDPSFAVTPDYYERAVAWDQTQAQRRTSEKLGWKLQVQPADEVDPRGRRAVRFSLADASGVGIPNAKLDVTSFHHSRAAEPVRFSITTDDDGKATQVMLIRLAGFWEFQCKAIAADGQVYTQTVTQFVEPPARIAAAGGAR